MNKITVRPAVAATAIGSIVLISLPSVHGIDFRPETVNRALKGDRLNSAPTQANNGHQSQPSLERVGKQVPVGCDRAFSSMSSAQFSALFGRCLA